MVLAPTWREANGTRVLVVDCWLAIGSCAPTLECGGQRLLGACTLRGFVLERRQYSRFSHAVLCPSAICATIVASRVCPSRPLAGLLPSPQGAPESLRPLWPV